MIRKMLFGTSMMLSLGLAGALISQAQDSPEPLIQSPDSGQIFVLSGGPAHLGATLGEVTAEKARELKLPAEAGAIVTAIQPGGAAAKAGLQKGDVILEFDGVAVRSSAELRRLVRETPAGRGVAVKVLRGGQSQMLHAKMEADAHFNMPDVHIPDFSEFQFPFHSSGAALGISGDDLTTQLAQFFGVKQGKGVLVREVLVGSAAEKAGLKAGDVIVQVDGKPVGGVDDLRAGLSDPSSPETRKVKLTIVRDHHEQTLDVELTPTSSGGRHRVGAAAMGFDPAKLAEIQQQAHALADQVRREVEMQRSSEQQEWQRELQEQMRGFREQMKNLPTLQITHASSTII